MSYHHTNLRGHITAADKARNDYAYIPFELPKPARRLHVRYRYSAPISSDRRQGGNVIDIGLFDPRGNHFPGGAGFRGWSGSARDAFTLTPDRATPGYLPGPLPAGTYQIILGLYRIWPHGVDYEIEIEAELDERAPQRPVPSPVTQEGVGQTEEAIALPPTGTTPGHLWLKGDLQSHTIHSDAQGTPEQLVAKAQAAGLDFLAITDHNTISHHAHLPQLADAGLLLIRGQEVTTYYGHMNVWGTSRWCDFRCRTTDDMRAVIDLAHANGGLCSINHPKQDGPAWEYGMDVGETASLPVDTLEVWQGPWPHRNGESLALWDRVLTEGRCLPAVGGSDYHCPSGADTNFLRLGQPTTWVKVEEPSVSAILAALGAGRACISAAPNGPRLDLRAATASATAEMGQTLFPAPDETVVQVTVEVVDGTGYALELHADGETIHTVDVSSAKETIVVKYPVQTYVRAELVGDMSPEQLPPDVPDTLDLQRWRWALSNPIYIRRT